MHRLTISHPVKALLSLALLLPTLAWAGGTNALAQGDDPDLRLGGGAVYTTTNAASENAVVMFNRSLNGRLHQAGTFSTGGLGSGDSLGSQGSLVLSESNHWLFAVNAGSNDISLFAVLPNRLILVDRVNSGGTRPVSLTVHRNLIYVLNAGEPSNITGFTLGWHGLTMIDGSTRSLSGAMVGPAQVQFSPDGNLLVVTEKMTNKIDTYTVGDHGLANGPNVQDSAGMTPFGFAFDRRGQLIVSEAFGGAPNQSAASSYDTATDGSISVISASVPTHQTAACWVVVTGNGRYAYTTNTGSGSITGYQIAQDGSLSLLDADGITGFVGDGSMPIDAGLSNGNHYLYVLASGLHNIHTFRVNSDGSLDAVDSAGNLPPSAAGLAVR